MQDIATQIQGSYKINGTNGHITKQENGIISRELPKPPASKAEEALHVKNASQGDVPFSGPLEVSTSSGFAWAKRRRDDASRRSHARSISKGHIFNTVEPSIAVHTRKNFDSKTHENGEYRGCTDSRGYDSYEVAKLAMMNQWGKLGRPDSFDASDGYHSQELSLALYQREERVAATKSDLVSLCNMRTICSVYICILLNFINLVKFWFCNRVFNFTMMETRLNFQDPCYLNHIKLMNF